MVVYNITIHYHNDPDDNKGIDDILSGDNIEVIKKQIMDRQDFNDIYYYVIESEDGEEYFNSSEEPDWEPED